MHEPSASHNRPRFGCFFGTLRPSRRPESFDSFVIHRPAFPAQEPGDAPIPIPPILRGQLDEARDQPGFVVRNDRLMPVCRPRLTEHSAGPPLRHAQPVLYMHHGRAAPGRTQKFPEATSLRIR